MFCHFILWSNFLTLQTKTPLRSNQGGNQDVSFKRRQQQHKYKHIFLAKPLAAALCRHAIVSPHTISFVLSCVFGPKRFIWPQWSCLVCFLEMTLRSWHNNTSVVNCRAGSKGHWTLRFTGRPQRVVKVFCWDSPYEPLLDWNNPSCNSGQCCFLGGDFSGRKTTWIHSNQLLIGFLEGLFHSFLVEG